MYFDSLRVYLSPFSEYKLKTTYVTGRQLGESTCLSLSHGILMFIFFVLERFFWYAFVCIVQHDRASSLFPLIFHDVLDTVFKKSKSISGILQKHVERDQDRNCMPRKLHVDFDFLCLPFFFFFFFFGSVFNRFFFFRFSAFRSFTLGDLMPLSLHKTTPSVCLIFSHEI